MVVTRISQSLLKAFFFKGNTRQYCARKIYHRYFLKEKVEETTDSQLKGIYFERQILGGNLINLPTRKNGEVRVDTLRIDSQVEAFRLIKETKLMQLYPMINTQLTIRKRYSFEYMLEGILDWFPTLFFTGNELKNCIIDIKLTKDLNNTYSEFSWGKPESMDLIQSAFYSYLVMNIDWENNQHLSATSKALIRQYEDRFNDGIFSFYYMVFDYKEIPEYRMIEVPYSVKLIDTVEDIVQNAIVEIEHCSATGWKPEPTSENCKRCLLQCEAKFEKPVQQEHQIIQLTN